MPMADDEVEEAVLEQFIFDTANDGCRVAFADLRDDDADGVGAFLAEAARHGIGDVAVQCGGVQYAALGFLGDAVCSGLTVDDAGDGGLRELEHRGELFECDRLYGRPGQVSLLPIDPAMRLACVESGALHGGRHLRIAHECIPDQAGSKILRHDHRDALVDAKYVGVVPIAAGWNASTKP